MTDTQIGVIMGATVLTLGTIVLVTLIIQLAASWRARAALAREEEYRRLAADSVAAQGAASEAGHRLAGELADVRMRLQSIEKLLRDVG